MSAKSEISDTSGGAAPSTPPLRAISFGNPAVTVERLAAEPGSAGTGAHAPAVQDIPIS